MYAIILEDGPTSITEQAKLKAEYRFQRVLEDAFSGPETYCTAIRLGEVRWSQTSQSYLKMIKRRLKSG
ncbi:hypothetical protein GGR41_000591 [Paenalcaligenes hominis]|uniref:Uncharacterized protein n=1 Tax=Paenalcaligenes hominis TaxID=643674 RepID=A0ABX0WNP2_9BURK|nr:hypothetical protein [Paenalcaligenes hominis]